MYHCDLCGTEFDHPSLHRWREPMPDGFREPCAQHRCPACGAAEPYFDKIPEEDNELRENRTKGRRLAQG